VTVRYHDRNPEINIVEPMVENPGMTFEKVNPRTVMIEGGGRTFKFEVVSGDATIELDQDESRFWFPFPSIKCHPIVLKLPVVEERHSSGKFVEEVVYRISIL